MAEEMKQASLTLDGRSIKLEELEAFKRKLQETSGGTEVIVEVAPGAYKTKKRING